MSAWNDFSTNDKLEWLRAKLTQIDHSLVALSHQVDEIGNAVKEIEEQIKKE
jgi:predicted  nucleic acid-binding Zn-ribbon protein